MNKKFCKPGHHKFKHFQKIERRLLWFNLKPSYYSTCVKCGVVRHENDGDLIDPDSFKIIGQDKTGLK